MLGVTQIIIFLIVLMLLALPLGRYMSKVFSGEKTWLDSIAGPVETIIYRFTGVKRDHEMNWKEYAWSLLIFNFGGILSVFTIELLQGHLPFNPQGMKAVSPLLALNTAVSFVTNTNWQAYAGENTMSYLTQMSALTVQNFLSAAVGIAVAVAFIRGISRRRTDKIGNFWVDMTRSVLWVLLPISLILALLLVSQGVIQNLEPYKTVNTLEGIKQTLAMGPAASQEAIKQLGTNGGGFFNVNSAHPFENPTPLTNFLAILALLLIPAALPFTYGYMVGNRRQGTVILTAMLLLFIIGLGVVYKAELYGNPQISNLGVLPPNAMEGKEVRFGLAGSALFATATTAASCGAVNTMHDSLTPLGGMVPMLQIMVGEVVFGGVGSGLYGMLIFVILTVFLVGLMVGRTPEYIGKKVESREIKMAVLAVLIPSAVILVGTAIAAVTGAGSGSISNPGPHGFSELLYAFSSAAGNNGSAFAGLNANTAFWNLVLSLAMLLGRFGVIIPALAIAGSLAQKQPTPPSAGTLKTTTWMFPVLLASVVLIVGALTFFPALALGPVVENLLMLAGTAF
ncbi:MAG TPA: potassium-transporting ATPase subunit KdpA [Syntrophomonadaceae bacterium]|nr:potassium-transporting ATPase subunit KdpA [Syntrophomonadaceae bacterium]